MRAIERVGAALALLVLAAGCDAPTSLRVTTAFDDALGVEQLRFEVAGDDGLWAPPVTRPDAPTTPLPSGETLLFLLPDAAVAQAARVRVTGLKGGSDLAMGTATTSLRLHDETALAVALAPGPPPPTLSVLPSGPRLASGDMLQLRAVRTDAGGSLDVTSAAAWITDTPAVATVAPGGLLTALSAGTVQVTALSNGVWADAEVTVMAAALVAIDVSPATVKLAKGTTVRLRVIGTYADGSLADLTGSAGYASSANMIATVDATGLVTAKAGGTATIRVTVGGFTDTCVVTVG